MDTADKQTDIDQKTGFGTYIVKQLYQVVISTGGLVGGAYAGVLAAKPFSKHSVKPEEIEILKEMKEIPYLRKLPGIQSVISTRQLSFGAGIGAAVGGLASTLVLGYGHWKKIKQAQLQVDEITKNVSDIEVFKKTDPELKAENERLWAELKARDGGESMVEKTGAKKHANWHEKTTEHAERASEAGR